MSHPQDQHHDGSNDRSNASGHDEAVPHPVPAHPLHGWRWPVVIVVVVITAFLLVREWTPSRVLDAGGKAGHKVIGAGMQAWKEMTRSEIETRVREFVSGIPVGTNNMHLVVTTLDVTKHIVAENRKRKFGIVLGTTKVSLSVPARLHYAVDLSGKQPIIFDFDSATGVFRVTFPDPEIQAVEIFSEDKETVVEVGWARLRSHSGRYLEEQLDRDLYREIRSQGSAPQTIRFVKLRSRPALAQFVARYLNNQGVWGMESGFSHIAVSFHSDMGPAAATLFDPVSLELEQHLEGTVIKSSAPMQPTDGASQN